jgi:hypothetical protein
MTPNLVIMAVRAAVRLGRAGQEAFGQFARDRAVMLPFVERIRFPKRDIVVGFLLTRQQSISAEAQPYWKSVLNQGAHLAGDFDVVSTEFARIQALNDADANLKPLADETTGLWMVEQWAKGAEPPGPLARVVLTIVDVAAEFAAQDPKLFGIDGNAELLVKALATRLADFIPDDANDFGPKNHLGGRLAGIFLRAGLAALSEHPEAVIEEERFQRLVKNTLPKLVDSLPDALDKQIQWRGVVEALLGPVANEAVRTLAADPSAFLGERLGEDDLLGALSRTFLLKAADIGLDEIFTKSGAVQLYKATVQLARARPELFLGDAAATSDKLVAAVFRDVAQVLEDSSPPFDHHVVAQLAAATVETLGREASAMLDPEQPWENMVSQTLKPALHALATEIRAGNRGALRRLGSQANVEAVIRIVMAQISRTPGMVAPDNPEIAAIVSAIAKAMAEDERLLLTHEDWMAVLRTALEEAAANPGRLVHLTAEHPDGPLSRTIRDLLAVATAHWESLGRIGGAVLFGPTLREALMTAIRAAASHSSAALTNGARVRELAETLSRTIATNADRYGSKEWLYLYRALLTGVMESGLLQPLDEAAIDAALAGTGGNA